MCILILCSRGSNTSTIDFQRLCEYVVKFAFSGALEAVREKITATPDRSTDFEQSSAGALPGLTADVLQALCSDSRGASNVPFTVARQCAQVVAGFYGRFTEKTIITYCDETIYFCLFRLRIVAR